MEPNYETSGSLFHIRGTSFLQSMRERITIRPPLIGTGPVTISGILVTEFNASINGM